MKQLGTQFNFTMLRYINWDCGFESRLGHGCLSVVSVECCQVEVFTTDWSLVQRSPTECGVSECDREASIMRRPWPTRGSRATEKKKPFSGIFANGLVARTVFLIAMWLFVPYS
jgi:hypothetical protein